MAPFLRHREEWPLGFEWNFAERLHRRFDGRLCGCALGLADLRWGSWGIWCADRFAGCGDVFSLGPPRTTPEEIADRLDAVAAGRQW